MSSVLVTGGAGFIGSHIANHLIQAGHSVVVLDDLSGGFLANVPNQAHFVKGSILDQILLKELFAQHSFAYVFHLAAYAAEGLSHYIRSFNYQNNVTGSVNLINLSILNQVRCFVFTSSIAVYGKNQSPMREDYSPIPEDPYGIAKFTVEQDLAASHRLFKLPYIVFRPHNVYGPKQNIGDKYRNVIGIFMNQLMQNQPMTIFGDGSQIRAFSFIDNVAPLIAQSIEAPNSYNHIFNIGANTPYTVNQLAQAVADAMSVKLAIKHYPARDEVFEAFPDHSKISRFLRLKPEVPLPIGLKIMANWAKQIGPQLSPEFPSIEVPINMPVSWQRTKPRIDANQSPSGS